MPYKNKRKTKRFFTEKNNTTIVIWTIVFIGFANWLKDLTFKQKILFYSIYALIIWYYIYQIYMMNKQIKAMEKETNVDIDKPYTIIQKLREMWPKEFEDTIAYLFTLKWYTIIQQATWKKRWTSWQAVSDKWIDLVAEKNTTKKYIQIKKIMNHQLSSSIVRDFYGTITDLIHEWDKGLIITTSIFSKDAREFAHEKWIVMVDYNELLHVVEQLKVSYKEEIEKYLNDISTKDNLKYKKYARTCKECYAPLVKRKWWSFFGCLNYYFTGCQYKE